jgi:hypothetical protein
MELAALTRDRANSLRTYRENSAWRVEGEVGGEGEEGRGGEEGEKE